jgi:hypothetical protein
MKSRLVDNTIIEILQPVVGHRIEDCFHADILAQCVDTPEGAQIGWIKQEDGSYKDAEGNTVYTPPPPPAEPEPEPAPETPAEPAPTEPAPETPAPSTGA